MSTPKSDDGFLTLCFFIARRVARVFWAVSAVLLILVAALSFNWRFWAGHDWDDGEYIYPSIHKGALDIVWGGPDFSKVAKTHNFARSFQSGVRSNFAEQSPYGIERLPGGEGLLPAVYHSHGGLFYYYISIPMWLIGLIWIGPGIVIALRHRKSGPTFAVVSSNGA